MIKEIGSEFWEIEVNQKSTLISEKNYHLLLTGRTALDFIIKDIQRNKEIKSIYMPSYCCHTMIKPFFDHKIEVKFYDVNFKNGQYTYEIDFKRRCDLVLIMQYFGFYNEAVEPIIDKLKESGKTVIEDATHSWFSEIPYSKKSDYVSSSFRKWTGLACGAIAIKRAGHFYNPRPSHSNDRYVEIRKKALRLKKKYIEEHKGQKEIFLKMFNEAENIIENDYQDYRIPKKYEKEIAELDVKKIREKRQENAKILNKGLKHLKTIKTVMASSKDVPLFAPIIVLDNKRDALQAFLAKNDIYCPVHWPLSGFHKIEDTRLYDHSLSLICDQRYSNAEMDKIVDVINDFY